MPTRGLALLCALALVGCQSTTIGSGPLTVTPAIKQHISKYFAERRRGVKVLALAVATDGQSSSYIYCPEVACKARDHRQEAINLCQRDSNGVPCKIYAIRDKVVWDGEIRVVYIPAGSIDQIFTGPAPQNKPNELAPAAALQTRAVAVSWEGIAELLPGQVSFSDEGDRGGILVSMPEQRECSGVYQYAEDRRGGSWVLTCDDNELTASGVFKVPDGGGAIGEGSDSLGRAVNFSMEKGR